MFSALYMVSRLKGIETGTETGDVSTNSKALYMVSRLKGIETVIPPISDVHIRTLYMLSRLKGIETWVNMHTHISDRNMSFGYGFPFEGN